MSPQPPPDEMNTTNNNLPGAAPWSVCANSWQYTSVYDENSHLICRLNLDDWGVTEENQKELEAAQAEIATKLSAVPELLEAVRDMLSGWKYIREVHGDLYGVGWDRAQKKAEDAIAKANGKESA